VVSSVIYSPILGHYEVNLTPIDIPYHSVATSAFIWVANGMTELASLLGILYWTFSVGKTVYYLKSAF